MSIKREQNEVDCDLGGSMQWPVKKEKLDNPVSKQIGMVPKFSSDSKLPRPNKKTRNAMYKMKNQSLVTKPLSKGENLVNLIRKRKLEYSANGQEPRDDEIHSDGTQPIKPHSFHVLNGNIDNSEDSVDVKDENFVQLDAKKQRILNAEELFLEEGPTTNETNLTFTVKSFRKALKGSHSISALRGFVKLLNRWSNGEGDDVATLYMEGGGSPLEILKTLDSREKDNFGHAQVVFLAVNILVMKGLTDSPAFKPSCEEACRHLLNAYLPVIQKMISETATAHEKKVALKLLTSIVSMNSVFARDVITSIHFPLPILRALTRPMRPGEGHNVRTCFIHFLLAFLVDTNTDHIKPLVDKHGLLTSIIQGLLFDKAPLVHLVLTTLRTSIVENKSFTKTQKFFIFNTGVIKMLIRLYEWRGPRNFCTTKTTKFGGMDQEDQVDAEYRQQVVEALDPLLTVLCTSHKLGVVFVDPTLGSSGNRHNELVWKVLKDLERPWEQKSVGDLVVRILKACPDLLKTRMVDMENFLEPRMSNSWVQAVEFVQQVLEAMVPGECLAPHLSVLSVRQLDTVIQMMCAPPPVLQVINTCGALLHEELSVRHKSLTLLATMLRQMEKFLLALDDWQTWATEAERSKFRSRVTKALPSGSDLVKSWELSISPKVENPPITSDTTLLPPPTSEHLLLLLELFNLYFRVCPHKLEPDDRVKLGLQQLRADVSQVVVDKNEVSAMDQVQMKAIQLAMTVDGSALQRDKKIFSGSVLLLLRLLGRSSAAVSDSASSALNSVLNATGLFKHSPGEFDIWMHCFRSLSTDLQESVATLLAKSLVTAARKQDKYADVVSSAEMRDVEADVPVDQEPHLSPLLPCMLKHISDTDTEILEYLNRVLIHLFHWLSKPDVLLRVVAEKFMYFHVSQYMSSWLDKARTPTVLETPFDESSREHKLSQIILKQSVVDIADVDAVISSASNERSVDAVSSAMVTDELIHLKLLFNLTLFHLTQLIYREELTSALSLNCENVLKALLKAQSTLVEGDSQCLRSLYAHPMLLQSFNLIDNTNNMSNLTTKLIVNMISWSNTSGQKNNLNILLKPYKGRLVTSMVEILKAWQAVLDNSVMPEFKSTILGLQNLFDLFELEFDEINLILTELSSVPLRVFFTSALNLSEWGQVMAFLLKRIKTLRLKDRSKSTALTAKQVKRISHIISRLWEKNVQKLLCFEESFLAYLVLFPHNLNDVPTSVFLNLLKIQNFTKIRQDIAKLLLSRKNVAFGKSLVGHMSSLSEKDLGEKFQILFPLLSVLISDNYIFPALFIQKMYECFEEQLMTGIKRPKKATQWMMENSSVLVYLIDHCMSEDTCAILCTNIQENITKHYSCQQSHIFVIDRVFSSSNNYEMVEVLLRIMTNSTSYENHNAICTIILKRIEQNDETCSWESLQTSDIWSQFTKHALKLGLQTSRSHLNSALLLETLSSLCDSVYCTDQKHEDIVQLFQMTCSHSEFLNVMLGSTNTKLQLVMLLTTLVKKNSSVMSASQIPILLGSYNASLSITDQIILQLLRLYENNNISMYECRPYLWGVAAVNHFCIKSKETQALWRQPTMAQVIDLLQPDMILKTVSKFPLDRKLNGELCSDQPDIYDPSFILPLFSHLLSSESLVQCYKFNHSGCLALTLASLASNSRSIRAAAYHVIARLYFHQEGVRGMQDKTWWLQFLDAIRNGVVDLGEVGSGPQLASIVSIFLARTSLVISQPLDPMFAPLNRFIVAKPSIDLNSIPELYVLFHSTDLNSRIFRHWILEVIKDGLRLKFDWELCLSSLLFKLLMVFYSSVIALKDKKSKILVLQIINSAVKLPGVAQQLVSSYGLFPWLHEAVRNLNDQSGDLVIAAARIANTLWTVQWITGEKVALSQNVASASYHQNIALLLVALLPVLPKTMSIGELKRYLVTMEAAATTPNSVISLEHVTKMVKFAKGVVGNVEDSEDLLEFGCTLAAKKSVGGANDSNEVDVKRRLRNMIIITKKEERVVSVNKRKSRRVSASDPLTRTPSSPSLEPEQALVE